MLSLVHYWFHDKFVTPCAPGSVRRLFEGEFAAFEDSIMAGFRAVGIMTMMLWGLQVIEVLCGAGDVLSEASWRLV